MSTQMAPARADPKPPGPKRNPEARRSRGASQLAVQLLARDIRSKHEGSCTAGCVLPGSSQGRIELGNSWVRIVIAFLGHTPFLMPSTDTSMAVRPHALSESGSRPTTTNPSEISGRAANTTGGSVALVHLIATIPMSRMQLLRCTTHPVRSTKGCFVANYGSQLAFSGSKSVGPASMLTITSIL